LFRKDEKMAKRKKTFTTEETEMILLTRYVRAYLSYEEAIDEIDEYGEDDPKCPNFDDLEGHTKYVNDICDSLPFVVSQEKRDIIVKNVMKQNIL